MKSLRAIALLAALSLTFLLTGPAFASHRLSGNHVPYGVRPDQASIEIFAGQVIALLGPSASPTGLGMQLQDGRLQPIRISPRTMFRARGAEAQVEGLMVGDFAVVYAERTGPDWTAQRVIFDVVPFGPIKYFTVSGTLIRTDRTGMRLLLGLGGGDTVWIVANKDTTFQVNGVPSDTAPPLTKGAMLEVSVHQTGGRWVALVINLKTPKPGGQMLDRFRL